MLTEDENRYVRAKAVENAKVVAHLVNDGSDPLEVCRQASRDFSALITPYITIPEALRSPEIRRDEFLQRMEDRVTSPGAPGYKCGFKKVDNYLLGFRPRLLYTIGGRPGTGKSLMGNQWALNISLQDQKPCWVIYFSPEQSDPELQDRTVTALSGLSAFSIATGKHHSGRSLDETEWRQLEKAANVLSKARLFTYDVTSQDCDTIERVIDEVMIHISDSEYPLGGFIVDYLQRLRRLSNTTENDSISQHVKGLKDIAKRKNLFCVMFSQINRDSQSERPNLASFRWSGDIEQESDVAMALHWPNESETNIQDVELLCLKNRQGPSNWMLNLKMDKGATWFRE